MAKGRISDKKKLQLKCLIYDDKLSKDLKINCVFLSNGISTFSGKYVDIYVCAYLRRLIFLI